jgi:D-alanine-D-alanine ligase
MQTVVGVLRGGPSHEHEISLRSGAHILTSLPEDRYISKDIYIDTAGQWHHQGRPVLPERILRQIDIALLPLHGQYGESGEVQNLLERFGVPYVGADAYGSHQARHKVIAKAKAHEQGFLTPHFHYIERAEDAESGARNVIRSFHQPVVVKAVGWGSSVGTAIVGGYAPVLAAVQDLFAHGAQSVLVEEYIRGREAAAGVVEGLRGELLYALPTAEIIPPEGDFFSYDSKYSDRTKIIIPGRFTRVENEQLQHIAKVMHRALNQRHYSRTDFIVSPKGIYFLETNSAAATGLTPKSLLPKALAAVGVSFSNFLTHLVNSALSR